MLTPSQPVTKVTKDYTFTGPNGTVTLPDMFHSRKQLILYHAMYDPSWETPCKSCSFLIDQIPKVHKTIVEDTQWILQHF